MTTNNLESDLQEARARIGELEKENNYLRGLVAAAKIPCVYCGLDNMGNCASGFPGCARADDLMVGEDEVFRGLQARIQELEKPVDDEEVAQAVTELEKVAERLARHDPRTEKIDYLEYEAARLLRRFSLQVKEGRARQVSDFSSGSQWQDISTAPKDGTEFLAYLGNLGGIQVVLGFEEARDDQCWSTPELVYYHRDAPTHWMPLPTPPVEPEKKTGNP